VDGIGWIRLHYAFPSGFPLDVLDVIRERENICRYIDIPLQHVSDDVLKSMRRGTTRDKTRELIATIRDRVPGIAIRTTLISGYPGESDKSHQELLGFIEESRFDRLGVFAYSHEENTHAYSLKDDVPDEVKQERVDEVMALQQRISAELNAEKVGKTFKVLFDRKDGDYFVGRTEFDSPEVDNEVLVEARNKYMRVGDFSNITITSAQEFDLFGIPETGTLTNE
jgi:ribosomal protein S12 methylthiotransferase